MKFLGRARKFLQELASEPESKVQYFNVTCASGHRVRGERTEGYQALRCPACGEGVFVLPRSPLPEPVAPARPAVRRTAGMGDQWVEEGPVELAEARGVALEVGGNEPAASDAEIIWEDEVGEEPAGGGPAGEDSRAPARRRERGGDSAGPGEMPDRPDEVAAAGRGAAARERKRRTKRPGPGDGAADRAFETAAAAGAERAHMADRREARNQPRRATKPARPNQDRLIDLQAAAAGRIKSAPRQRTMHRLILVGVPLLVIMTIGWRYMKSRRQEYPLIAERGRVEGIKALDEGNFDKAHQLLSAAKVAVDALGGAVDEADTIRDAAKEAAIFVDQAGVSLEEMLEEAGRAIDPQTWATKFDAVYKGRSVVIDSWITASPGTDGATRCELAYKVFPAGGTTTFNANERSVRPPRIGWIDLTGFELFEQPSPKAGTRVTFGARLRSFEFDADNDVWAIRLVPDSGVLIAHTKALEALGWPPMATTKVDFPEADRP